MAVVAVPYAGPEQSLRQEAGAMKDLGFEVWPWQTRSLGTPLIPTYLNSVGPTVFQSERGQASPPVFIAAAAPSPACLVMSKFGDFVSG